MPAFSTFSNKFLFHCISVSVTDNYKSEVNTSFPEGPRKTTPQGCMSGDIPQQGVDVEIFNHCGLTYLCGPVSVRVTGT